MKKTTKIILSCLAVLMVIVIGYYTHYFIHFVWYDEYKEALESYAYEEGSEFTPLLDAEKKVPGMELVAENDTLKLYANLNTTEIAVYDKRNDSITYSNPVNADEDAIATGINKSFLKSQLIISYYNDKRTSGTMNSYDLSSSKGQFVVEGLEEGIRFIYTFGNLESPTGIVPVYITEERLKIYLDKMDAVDARNVKGKYQPSKTVEGFLELTSGSMKKSTLAKMNKQFEAAGYTNEDYLADMGAASGEEAEVITFTIPLEYRLKEDGLEVVVPTKEIEENGGAKIYSLELLRYFGAAGTSEAGYMVVPNGSGSLIHFNNGKKTAPSYTQYVYGIDPLTTDYTVIENTEDARFPVFGMKRDDSAFLGMIEKGDSLAAISADISGKVNSYNYVYPSFILRGSEKLAMFGSVGQDSDLPVVESDMYQLDLKVKYSFLDKEEASYSGMASFLRNKLTKEGVLTLNEEKDSIPFYLDVIGGVKQTAYFLGVPYLDIFPATTFTEAMEITDKLYDMNINNVRMNYQGWFNGGYYHDVADKIKIVKELGNKKDLEVLSSSLEARGGKLYGDVAFQNVTYISKGYRYQVESSKYYAGGYVASFGQINPVSLRKTAALGYRETIYNVLSPKFLPRYVEEFVQEMKDIEVTGISLRDLGDNLYSDKKRTNVINREQAKEVIMHSFEELATLNKEVMISGGNYYALSYVDEIINMPLSHNSFYLIDEEIPFYQMILHGSIDYTGYPINLSDSYDTDDIVLRLLEYGASPHFTFSYEDSNNFKYSGLNRMYATKYENWLEDAKEVYEKVNSGLKYVTDAVITNHTIISPGVRSVSYDNGVTILINYNHVDATVFGERILARSYAIKGVDE